MFRRQTLTYQKTWTTLCPKGANVLVLPGSAACASAGAGSLGLSLENWKPGSRDFHEMQPPTDQSTALG